MSCSLRALNGKIKSLFTSWKSGSIKKSKYGFGAFSGFVFEWYLFQLIVCLNPDFNCCNSFVLSWVGEITTGTKYFVSVIANVVFWFAAALDITQKNNFFS